MDFTPFILYTNQNKNKKRGNKTMPQIVAPPESQSKNEPIITTCPHCHYTISYTEDEVDRMSNNAMGIFCPQCGEEIETEYVEPFTFPKTFFHFSVDKGSVDLSNEEVQSYVNIVKRKIQEELKIGEYTFTGSGDTMVFGFKFADENQIIVAKGYWSDSVFKE